MEKLIEKIALILMVIAILAGWGSVKLFGIVGIMIGEGVLIVGLLGIAVFIHAAAPQEG